jgi:2-haloacid dehalogenase
MASLNGVIMSVQPTKSRFPVVVFDAYGTLFDVYSVTACAERLFPGKGAELSLLWRQKQVEYSWLRTMSQKYKSFWEVTEDALIYAISRLALTAEASAIATLMNEYRALSLFSENKEVLVRLKSDGVRLGILTNGNREMIDAVLRSAGLEAMFEHVLTSDQVGTFKTNSAMYDLAPQAFGVTKSEILFVSSNGWDAAAATWYGMNTFWVNRSGLCFESLDVMPTFTDCDLNGVARVISVTPVTAA